MATYTLATGNISRGRKIFLISAAFQMSVRVALPITSEK